jgi:O-antigen/teichoic acid export membrane protein
MRSLKTDTLLNLFGAGFPILVAIPTVPMYLQTIGQERYGVLAICWIIVGYFAFFDFGMGKAVNQRIAASPEQASKVLWMGLFLSGCLGVLGSLVVLLGGLLLENLSLSQDIRLELRTGLPWLSVAVLALTMTSVLQGGLEAKRDFVNANLVSISANGLLSLLPLLAAYLLGNHLHNLLFATAVARGLTLGIAIWFNRRTLRSFTAFRFTECTKLLQFGGWVTVTGVVGPILTSADQIFIGVRLGTDVLAIYNITFNMVTRASIIGAASMRALFPRFAEQTPQVAKQTRQMALVLLVTIITPVVLLALVSFHPVFTWWLGLTAAKQAIPIAILLVFGVWINTLAFVPFTWLQATGKPEIPARFHLAELIPYGILLWLFIPQFGIIGAAFIWTLRNTLDAFLLFSVSKDDLSVVFPYAGLVIASVCAGLFGLFWIQIVVCFLSLVLTLHVRPWVKVIH